MGGGGAGWTMCSREWVIIGGREKIFLSELAHLCAARGKTVEWPSAFFNFFSYGSFITAWFVEITQKVLF